ncbi:hypothetical protein [Histidinibacterium lentulum]|uniref:DUF2244 domain-containing protein n=1 Tax=Histidinibacterium lentulum TaxID=2480588 RepID=A0A3N2R7Q4_9RHOB|nr:hypothetical protein [Histidinibacterium lentulum]ROU03356.1 hypothetical protein EAT49_03340 [Histidinibacterium lentulum]
MRSSAPLPGELLRLESSPPRRLFALGVLYGLGALVLLLAFGPVPGLAARLALLGLGGLILWQAERMRRGTAVAVVLTGEGLFESGGRVIARRAEMLRVDRSLFAFKPTNGFLVHLSGSAPAVWSPGLWWRIGRRVGIGGVVAGAEARAMADRLSLLLETGQ